MKKTLLVAIIAGTALLFNACKKDSAKSKSTLEKVQGKWMYEKSYYHEYYGGTDYRDTLNGNSAAYVDFRTDGKVYYNANGSLDTAAYSVLGDNKIIMSFYEGTIDAFKDTGTIQVLTDNQLQIYVKEFYNGPEYYEYTDYLKK